MLSSLTVIKNGHIAIFSSVRFEMIDLAKIALAKHSMQRGMSLPKLPPLS